VTQPLRRRGRVVQIAGFCVGIALLVWCIHAALKPEAAEGWQRLFAASPAALIGLLACSLVSAAVNGAMFWISIRPARKVRLRDMQILNVTASMLNYAPVRLGAMARIVYHVRVDQIPLRVVGAWFILLAGIVLVAAIPAAGLLLFRPNVDALFLLLSVSGAMLGIFAARFALLALLGVGWIGRVASDSAAIIRSLWALPAATALRLLDFAAYGTRLWIAIGVLGLTLSPADAALLAVVALVTGLIPFGRLGFREFCVAIAAQQLAVSSEQIESSMAQLALIDSAAEMLVLLPLGAIGLFWYRNRVLRGTR